LYITTKNVDDGIALCWIDAIHFGWNGGLDLSENSSLFRPRRRNLRDFYDGNDDYVIFEDIHEGELPTKYSKPCQEYSTNIISEKVDQSVHIRPHSVGNDTSFISDLRETTTFTNQENGSAAMTRTLYIQMQLCIQKRLADFLKDRCARSISLFERVDIPKPLRIFVQIADARAHVHECGLIHHDSKPSNFFTDDLCLMVKVGNFCLNRESRGDDDLSIQEDSSVQDFVVNEDRTAGVGTHSYASPEQMSGSNYDSSADVFHLW
jgi:serine/threonine protein kinase